MSEPKVLKEVRDFKVLKAHRVRREQLVLKEVKVSKVVVPKLKVR